MRNTKLDLRTFPFVILFIGICSTVFGQSVNSSPNTPLEFSTQLAYFNPDSIKGAYGLYQLPDTFPAGGLEGGPLCRIFAFSERFTPRTVGPWYLDSAIIAFHARKVTSNLVLYALTSTEAYGWEYPGEVFDSVVIAPESILDSTHVHFYTLAFHHTPITNPSFFLSLSIGSFSSNPLWGYGDPHNDNQINVYGDNIHHGWPPFRQADSNLDRTYYTAQQLTSDTVILNFMKEAYAMQTGYYTSAGLVYEASTTLTGDLIYPNLYFIAKISTPSGVSEGLSPSNFKLEQNYPNGASSRTSIDFSLNTTEAVSLKLYNSLGQEIATLVEGTQSEGLHSVSFDVSKLVAGAYFYTLRVRDRAETRTMVVTH